MFFRNNKLWLNVFMSDTHGAGRPRRCPELKTQALEDNKNLKLERTCNLALCSSAVKQREWDALKGPRDNQSAQWSFWSEIQFCLFVCLFVCLSDCFISLFYLFFFLQLRTFGQFAWLFNQWKHHTIKKVSKTEEKNNNKVSFYYSYSDWLLSKWFRSVIGCPLTDICEHPKLF